MHGTQLLFDFNLQVRLVHTAGGIGARMRSGMCTPLRVNYCLAFCRTSLTLLTRPASLIALDQLAWASREATNKLIEAVGKKEAPGLPLLRELMNEARERKPTEAHPFHLRRGADLFRMVQEGHAAAAAVPTAALTTATGDEAIVRFSHFGPSSASAAVAAAAAAGRNQRSAAPRKEAEFNTAGGVNLPKIVYCYGEDGRMHKQLVKGRDDLRGDAVMQQVLSTLMPTAACPCPCPHAYALAHMPMLTRVCPCPHAHAHAHMPMPVPTCTCPCPHAHAHAHMQVFGFLNVLLERDAATRQRALHMRTYRVVPLAPTAGVLQWVDDSMALSYYLTGSQSAHERYRPLDWTHSRCRKMMKDVHEAVGKGTRPKGASLEAYRLVTDQLKPVL